MFLRSLSIRNLRSIGDLSISFEARDEKEKLITRKQTLLLGQNGTGKSSLLRAIALLTAGSNALGELLGQTDDWIRNGADSCELSAVLVTKLGEERTVRLTLRRGASLRDVLAHNEESIDQLESALTHADRNYFVVGYGASRRLNMGENAWYSQRGAYSSGRSNNVATLFRNDAELNPLTAWAIDLDYQANNPEAGLQVIRQALDDLLPGVRFNAIDKVRKQLLFETAEGLVPLHLLSDGYQNMTAWIGDLLHRISTTFHDYRTPLDARGLLLIDEVDLHIHPAWQRHLLTFLRGKLPNFQIVATTHSPLTAQQAAEGELFSLRRGPQAGQVELLPFIGNPQKMLLHQLMMSEAFGLETDESVVIEEAKNTYRALHDKKESQAPLTPAENHQFEQLSSELRALPGATQYSNTLLDANQMALLQELKQELSR